MHSKYQPIALMSIMTNPKMKLDLLFIPYIDMMTKKSTFYF